jgi:hypothetical protein
MIGCRVECFRGTAARSRSLGRGRDGVERRARPGRLGVLGLRCAYVHGASRILPLCRAGRVDRGGDFDAGSSSTVERDGATWESSAQEASHKTSQMYDISVSAPGRGVIIKGKEKIQLSNLGMFVLGGMAAVGLHYLVRFIGTLPAVKYFVKRYLWWAEPKLRSKDYISVLGSESEDSSDEDGNVKLNRSGGRTRGGDGRRLIGDSTTGRISLDVGASSDDEDDTDVSGEDFGEPVEWVNMCWRKAWRVYQRGLERWLEGLLQPVFDKVVKDKVVPKFVQRLKITEFTLDHEAPYFTNMKRRTSRKDSDLNGVVDVRYTGGARMVLSVELGTSQNRLYRLKVPVMVSDLDLECKLWLKLRLAPMCPYIGTLSMAFVGPPTIKLQLSPYDRIKLMRIPVIQPFLTKLFTVDLPRLMVLPKRLEIAIPPAVTAVAEAAIGRDAVMRAVASAVLEADALEHALISALPLGPQGAAGGISLPDLFRGELQVVLKGAKNLPVWGFPWQSNPYCRVALGDQAVMSRKDNETSQQSRHRGPVWNQEFQFLVEDAAVQALEIWIMDSPITGRTDVAYAKIPLSDIPSTGNIEAWFDLESTMPAESTGGSLRLSLTYRPFQDDENDSGYREAAAQVFLMEDEDIESEKIIDIKSAADASSRAAVAASAAAAAVAVTKAAAARAAARLSRGAAEVVTEKGGEAKDEEEARGTQGQGERSKQENEEHVSEGTENGSEMADENREVVVSAGEAVDALAEPEEGRVQQTPSSESDGVHDHTSDKTAKGESSATQTGTGTVDESSMISELSDLSDSLHNLAEDAKGFDDKELTRIADAERLAATAIASRGDIHQAAEVLHQTAESLDKDREEAAIAISGEEKAKLALEAAKEALAAAEGMEGYETATGAKDQQERYHAISSVSDSEDSLGAETLTVISGNKDSSGGSSADFQVEEIVEERQENPWWSQAAGWVMDRLPGRRHDEEGSAFGDGSGEYMSFVNNDSLTPEERRKLPVGDIVIGEDIPLEEIAAEVRKSWKQRDVHVERLVRQQMEARQRQSEIPLLMVTSIMATSSAILLSIVLYRLMNQ